MDLPITAPAGQQPPTDPRLFGTYGTNLVLYADMNGDGLVDWVAIDTGGGVMYWLGHGDGTFGSCASGLNDCTGDARFKGAKAATVMKSEAGIGPGSTVLLHDLNGDGFADLIVESSVAGGIDQTDGWTTYDGQVTAYFNEGGQAFGYQNRLSLFSAYTEAVPPSMPEVFFADMNGSGVDDYVQLTKDSSPTMSYSDVLGGRRPGLLTGINNGYGVTTTIDYASTTTLATDAADSGDTWTTHSPQILHHVLDVKSSNNLPAPYGGTRAVTYAYSNPIYDGRDRQFVGFQTVTVRTIGDASEPTMSTRTTYLTGVCSADGGTNCPATGVDRPYLALRGLPVMVDTFDDTGHHLSTTHTRYGIHRSAVGVDGRGVRFAYPSIQDSYFYDSSVASGASGSTAAVDAAWDDDASASLAPRTVPLAAAMANVVQTQSGTAEDINGNVTSETDYGVVGTGGGKRPRDGAFDSPVTHSYAWATPSGDATSFQWRPTLITRAAFPTAAGAPAPDQPLAVQIVYGADGQVMWQVTTLTGALGLSRAANGAQAPAASLGNGGVVSRFFVYDSYGNERFDISGASCTELEYDAPFALLPTSQIRFRDGCTTAGVPLSSAALSTSQSFDYGFAQPTMSVSATGAITTHTYDGFGRVASTTLPDPVSGAPQKSATVSVTYYDNTATPPTTVGVKKKSVATADGSNTRYVWSYADGWDAPLSTISPGDTSQGDAAAWIASGQVQRSARGHVVHAYAPYPWTGSDPGVLSIPLPPVIPPAGPFVSATYDAFGRVVSTVGLDGVTRTSSHLYYALEEDVTDAEQLSGGHTSASSYTIWDGHNRVARRGRFVLTGTTTPALDEIATTTAYTAGGKPWVVTQSHSTPGASVTRTLQYDSLGRLVGNLEPNTSTAGIGWRYAYDANGRLVGTSDANGCGENLAYDGLGRLVWEDYSPCNVAQATYTSGPSSWSNLQTPFTTSGVETFYAYDPISGRVSSSYDRGAMNSYLYDARGRITSATRALASPSLVTSSAIATPTNYSPHSFSRSFVYDDLGRTIGATTGADSYDLLGTSATAGNITSSSLIAATYSARGALATVAGSYGTLLASNVVDADGAPRTQVLGDAAGTTSFHCYDANRNVSEIGIYRGTSLPVCAHAPVGTVGKAVASPKKILDDQYVRDKVGNPVSITDLRTASEWALGALPVVRRALYYDDSYRLTYATYAYPSSSGDTTAYAPTSQTSANQNPLQPIATATGRVQTQGFTYDWLGNTTSTTDDESLYFERGLPVITNGTATAGPNRIISARTAGSQGCFAGKCTGGSTNVTYDNAGNVTSLSAVLKSGSCTQAHCAEYFTFEWDELGQLAHATRTDDLETAPAADVHYVYDGAGRRVLRSSRPQGSANPTYDAEIFPSLRLNNAAWQAGADVTVGGTYAATANEETPYLVFGSTSYGRVVVTGLTAQSFTQHVFLTLSDAAGSTAAVVDKASGELVERLTYTAYGSVESDYRPSDWGTFSEEYKYTGKDPDAEIGLTYFGARYYSPNLGRWLSPDPLAIHGVAGDPNPYAFVHGSPMRYVDPTGLDGCDNLGAGCQSSVSLSGQGGGTGSGGGIDLSGFGRAAAKVASDVGHAFSCIFGGCGGGAQTAAPPPPPPSTARAFFGSAASAAWSYTKQGWQDSNNLEQSQHDSIAAWFSKPDPFASGDQLGATGGAAILMVAQTAATSFSMVEEAAAGTTTLYRAVSQAELADIAATGGFRGGAGSMGNKWFAESAEDAAAWGKKFFSFDKEPIFTVRVQVPNSVADQMTRVPILDSIGPARSAEGAVLDLVNSQGSIDALGANAVP